MSNAIITGASRGLGLAVARVLAEQGWRLVLDARGGADLERAARELGRVTEVVAVPGDVADAAHRRALVSAAGTRIDLIINNASTLGASPLPPLADYPLDALERVYRVNVLGPLGLIQAARPHLSANATIVNISSDAAVEGYPGWGGYGSSKAALDQLTATLGGENPNLRVYAVDPGDMRTRMHQDAFPGEDISDRPEPHTVVPVLLDLLRGDQPSGRYRLQGVAA
ncbi:putative oxidoreductase [Baekduia alba]|uniref:SDR family NAD(P)-dependent oxidoreductase n=1 Tax=Baekduia alba TaxID=2997333 RepID=UPI002341995B|nr:SDR family oxidoreductase [Baekduia alba]WCB92184.1 putative oxidoreductase [Baekduia alba]